MKTKAFMMAFALSTALAAASYAIAVPVMALDNTHQVKFDSHSLLKKTDWAPRKDPIAYQIDNGVYPLAPHYRWSTIDGSGGSASTAAT